MKHSRRPRSVAVIMLATTLSGGTLLGGCPTRFKEAAVDGTKDYFLTDFLTVLFDVEVEAGDSSSYFSWL